MNESNSNPNFTSAVAHLQAGRFADAERECRAVLAEQPEHVDAIYLLGLALLQQRKSEDAIAEIRRAISLRGEAPEYHANLGHAFRAIGQLDDAAKSYERAIALKPDYALALSNLGSIRRAQRRFDDALDCFERATQLQPNLLAAWMNFGNALRDLGRTERALHAYGRAIAIDPRVADAHGSAATMLGELGREGEAIAEFEKAIDLSPNHVPTLINYSLILRGRREFDRAIEFLNRAISIDPNNAAAHEQLGRTLLATCDTETALEHYDHAMRLAPSPRLRMTIATLLPPIYRSIDDVNWWRARIEREVEALHTEGFRLDITHHPPPSIVYLPYQGLEDRALAVRIAELCSSGAAPSPSTLGEGRGEGELARRESRENSTSIFGNALISESRIVEPVIADDDWTSPVSEVDETKKRRRIGFISSLFRDQTVGLWMQGLIAQLDRAVFDVIVISTMAHADRTGAFIHDHADEYIVLPRSLPEARRAIAKLDLDALIYAELGMDPWMVALAHARLAPVQCVTLGHPITSGIPTIDYFISSALVETEDAQRHYSEKLARLPNLPVYYYRPAPPAEAMRRADFAELNLVDDDHVYGCLQAQYKLHPSFDAAIGGILREDPRGVILLSREGSARGEDLIRARIGAAYPDVIDRVRFVPALSRDQFRGLTALCDVLLAPFPFGAGDSSLEGFALNVPTITLPTEYLKGRLTFAMYQLMQIDDCIARDIESYVSIALRFGTDAEFNAQVRAKIAAKSHLLFENAAGVRDLERFLLQTQRQ